MQEIQKEKRRIYNYNTISFSASLSIISLLAVMPLRNRISLWILLVTVSIKYDIDFSGSYLYDPNASKYSKQDSFGNQIIRYHYILGSDVRAYYPKCSS